MSSVVAAWPHYRPIISSLKVTYLWFVGFLGLFLLLVAIPALLQPVALDYELAFNAPSEEGWSVEELEAQLQEISREIVIIPGEQMPDHEADFIILWSHSAPRSEVGSDPFGSRIDAVLKAMNPPKIHGLRINMSRTDDGENLLRPTSLAIWLPFTILLFAFFCWQRRCRKSISQSRTDRIGLKAIVFALVASILLAPIVGLLIAWMAPESASRIPEVGFSLNNWPALLTLILLIPLAEEIAFRSWLLDRLGQVLAPSIALLISAAAFSAVHPMGLIANLIFLLPGLVWGYLWLRYRSLFVCTLAHATYNATAITMASLQSV